MQQMHCFIPSRFMTPRPAARKFFELGLIALGSGGVLYGMLNWFMDQEASKLFDVPATSAYANLTYVIGGIIAISLGAARIVRSYRP